MIRDELIKVGALRVLSDGTKVLDIEKALGAAASGNEILRKRAEEIGILPNKTNSSRTQTGGSDG